MTDPSVIARAALSAQQQPERHAQSAVKPKMIGGTIAATIRKLISRRPSWS